ncbi:MAG: sialidase family protein [Isosphaeraceae bacterium]
MEPLNRLAPRRSWNRRDLLAQFLAWPLAAGIARQSLGAEAERDEPATRFELVSVRKIWSGAGHNAFTGLIRHRDRWLCVFREGSGHIPGTDGQIRVIASPDGKAWSSVAALTLDGVDLRDPKISLMPDGRLMILMGGSIYSGKNGETGRKRTGARARVSFSTDGTGWTPPKAISIENQWLWRVTWHEGAGYGFGYRIDEKAGTSEFALWKTTDGLHYERVVDPELPRGTLANETTIRFLADGTMLALVRNEASKKRGNALVGFSARAPYDRWRWIDAGRPAQGPDVLVLADGRILYGGRDFPDGARTVLGVLSDGPPLPRLTLPGEAMPRIRGSPGTTGGCGRVTAPRTRGGRRSTWPRFG